MQGRARKKGGERGGEGARERGREREREGERERAREIERERERRGDCLTRTDEGLWFSLTRTASPSGRGARRGL